jgi:hypothetical protein
MLKDDCVSITDANRHDGISRNGSSGFGGIADSAETADLGGVISEGANRGFRLLGRSPRAGRGAYRIQFANRMDMAPSLRELIALTLLAGLRLWPCIGPR